jgi:hypothetical protein
MKQMTLAVTGLESHGKKTRNIDSLVQTDKLVPWMEFCSVFNPYFPKTGNERTGVTQFAAWQ